MSNFVSYKTAIKDQVVDALQGAIRQDLADQDLVRGLSVDIEYPSEEIHFPRIIVGLQERSLHIAGIGHDELTMVNGVTELVRHYRFEGMITFKIFALSSLSRDKLSGLLVNILAFPNANDVTQTFHQRMYNSEFIDIQFANDNIIPQGDGVEDVPWEDPNRKVYTAQYAINVMGEFYTSSTTLSLVTIGDVKVYPYREDQNPPSGSTNPADIDIPWTH